MAATGGAMLAAVALIAALLAEGAQSEEAVGGSVMLSMTVTVVL